jgi:hypothetical protein
MITSHGYETRVRNSGSHHLQTNSNLHWSLAAAMLALFLSAIDSTAGETRIPGSSFPPDKRGEARQGAARPCKAWHGAARQGKGSLRKLGGHFNLEISLLPTPRAHALRCKPPRPRP